jgi:arylsulfatase A-like enzyme
VTAATFWREWARVTVLAAGAMSIADALLLQRSRGLFTGGFLAADHLDGTLDRVAFLAGSLIIDGAVAGAVAAVALYVLARRGLTRRAALGGAFLFAVGPLAVADVISYQLMRYLGVGFDLGLLFDLTGRSVSEMFAVASSHLLLPTLLIGLLAASVGGVIWMLNRLPGPRLAAPPARAFAVPALALLIGIIVFTVAVSVSDALTNGLARKPSGGAMRLVVVAVTDVDRDGFGLIGNMPDPDPFDASVFPYAADRPGNGVDENGVAGDLPPSAGRYAEMPTSAGRWLRTPDVVLIVLESFRADLVGARLQGKPITPVIDALGARGVRVPDAYSHNGYTIQSRYHLLAGTLEARRDAPTLIDDFKRHGYVVGYFSGQDESFGAEEYRVGFDRADVSFDARSDVSRRYSTFATPGSLAIPHEAVQERIAAFVRDRTGDTRPMFLYVSFEDSHFPYSHAGLDSLVSEVRLSRGQITPERREALFEMYANTAANIDRAIGTALETVEKARGRAPAVIVTADHGESLFDHGFLGHGYHLNDVQTQVPMVVANLPMRVPSPFSHIDLRPALNEALQVPPDHPSSTPSVRPVERPVFQYLGDLRRPRQIAWLVDGKRFVYDFRTRRVQPRTGEWLRPAELAPADATDFRTLVQQWEWMSQARPAGGDEP